MILTYLAMALLGVGLLALGRWIFSREARDRRRAEQRLQEIAETLRGLADGSVDFAILEVEKEGWIRGLQASRCGVPRHNRAQTRSLLIVRRFGQVSAERPTFLAEEIHVN